MKLSKLLSTKVEGRVTVKPLQLFERSYIRRLAKVKIVPQMAYLPQCRFDMSTVVSTRLGSISEARVRLPL